MKSILIILIRIYQATFSPMLGCRCRYVPSCSEYALFAIKDRGAWAGMGRAVKRLLRCHPFSKSGWDPYLPKGKSQA